MKQLSLEAKGGQWLADLASWERESAPDNREQLERLHRNLRLARQQALTDRQRQMLELYYDQGLTMGQIALKLHRFPDAEPAKGQALPLPALQPVKMRGDVLRFGRMGCIIKPTTAEAILI